MNTDQNMYFSFTYLKGTSITHFDQPNLHFKIDPLTGTHIEASRTLKIHGSHFVDLTDEMLCRVIFAEDQVAIIPAVYINNHTLECDTPAPPVDLSLPIAASIEVSFN